jgi:hypothetical protein
VDIDYGVVVLPSLKKRKLGVKSKTSASTESLAPTSPPAVTPNITATNEGTSESTGV